MFTAFSNKVPSNSVEKVHTESDTFWMLDAIFSGEYEASVKVKTRQNWVNCLELNFVFSF